MKGYMFLRKWANNSPIGNNTFSRTICFGVYNNKWDDKLYDCNVPKQV